jgi:hypothetical protein
MQKKPLEAAFFYALFVRRAATTWPIGCSIAGKRVSGFAQQFF